MKSFIVNQYGKNEIVHADKPSADWAPFIICEAPPNGDIDILDIVDDIDGSGNIIGKKAVVSLVKQEIKDNIRHAQQLADQAVAYKEKRRAEYPSELNVIEALMEDKEGRPAKLDAIKIKRAAIKLKHPKPL